MQLLGGGGQRSMEVEEGRRKGKGEEGRGVEERERRGGRGVEERE